jgi:Predicted integral membrane protein (DUF2269)
VSNLVPILLPIHVLTAIVAFGPNFAMPIIARMAAQEPQHGLFALRLTDRIERRLVLPLALTMPISGGLLALAEGINPLVSHWLLIAIVLYVAAMTYALAVQVRTVDRMIEIASHLAPAGAAFAAGPGAALARPETIAPAAAAATTAAVAPRLASPMAEMAALGVRARNGGFFLMAMVFIIVSLMAGKPTL